jgi:hypothetical protein
MLLSMMATIDNKQEGQESDHRRGSGFLSGNPIGSRSRVLPSRPVDRGIAGVSSEKAGEKDLAGDM